MQTAYSRNIYDYYLQSYQVPLREADWHKMNSPNPVTREDFMSVLKDLKRVLVRATLSDNIQSTAIADVSMDTAVESNDPTAPAAKGVEVCTYVRSCKYIIYKYFTYIFS